MTVKIQKVKSIILTFYLVFDRENNKLDEEVNNYNTKNIFRSFYNQFTQTNNENNSLKINNNSIQLNWLAPGSILNTHIDLINTKSQYFLPFLKNIESKLKSKQNELNKSSSNKYDFEINPQNLKISNNVIL